VSNIPLAVVVRGGWDGHRPVEATDRYVARLRQRGYEVETFETLDVYLDEPLLSRADLVVQCWTMGRITAEQTDGLRAAVRGGTGFAGWHGGIVDAFRDTTGYQAVTGGQFVHHPHDFVTYEVRPLAARREHPIVAGIGPFTVHTEQYWVHTAPDIDVLAVTDVVQDADEPFVVPVVWTRRWGAGRVFVTTVGHELKDLEVPAHDEIIMRGLTWATR